MMVMGGTCIGEDHLSINVEIILADAIWRLLWLLILGVQKNICHF
jgi:hypothetical protein